METAEGHQRKAEETAASDAWVAMPYLAACTWQTGDPLADDV